MSYRRLDGSNTPLAPVPKDYARLLAQGWDTVQEAMALKPLPAFVTTLEERQEKARQIGDSLEGSVPLELGNEVFQVSAVGARGGFRWRLENDDLLILIGSPKRDWTISVRYLSAGLWEHGLGALRERVASCLGGHTKRYGANGDSNDWVRTSRCDWCFDFYSPAFTEEFVSSIATNVVAHSSVKKHEHFGIDAWSCGVKGETLTIGKITGVQLQLYNKAKEITDMSGKTWMWDVWVAGLDGEWVWSDDKVRDVYRLEVRFGKDFLKDRNIRRPSDVNEHLRELVNEALHNRRLTTGPPSAGVDTQAKNRQRWPMHPLWVLASREFDIGRVLPIGRQVTGRRDELTARAVLQLAGAARSSTVLKHGLYSSGRARELLDQAFATLESDPEHLKKEAAAQSRYANVDDAA